MLQLGAMRLVEDAPVVARAGEWLETTANQAALDVSWLVTSKFQDYARIFHPAMREASATDLPLRSPHESVHGVPVQSDKAVVREVRWVEVANANGTVAHPAMQWASITGSYRFRDGGAQAGLWDEQPQKDSLPHRLALVLSEVLEPFTATPDCCWCAVWEGYGDLVGLRAYRGVPRLMRPGTNMLLAHGRLDAVAAASFSDAGARPPLSERYRSPNFWWPDDRAWCVATDVDFDSTYLGASAECVAAVISDPRLEAMRVPANQSITWDSDTINPLPPRDQAANE
jgi:hypothetical protein